MWKKQVLFSLSSFCLTESTQSRLTPLTPTAKPLYRIELNSTLKIWQTKNNYLLLTLVNTSSVIKSFADKETEKIWEGFQSKKLPADIQNVARRKLRMINNSQNINDLRIPPANHLEKLSGNLSGFHSIRINRQWRIIFKWENDNALEVEIVDYH